MAALPFPSGQIAVSCPRRLPVVASQAGQVWDSQERELRSLLERRTVAAGIRLEELDCPSQELHIEAAEACRTEVVAGNRAVLGSHILPFVALAGLGMRRPAEGHQQRHPLLHCRRRRIRMPVQRIHASFWTELLLTAAAHVLLRCR